MYYSKGAFSHNKEDMPIQATEPRNKIDAINAIISNTSKDTHYSRNSVEHLRMPSRLPGLLKLVQLVNALRIWA
jgi:hypothetical protein